MPMRAAFIMKDGYMVPDFTSSSNDTMDLKWSPPPTMRLYLMVYCPIGSPLYSETQFLVAVDGNGRFWRLPTSNTYEDCKLCTGSYNSEGATFVDVLSRAWNQFQTSRWQKDLNDRGGTSGMSNSRMMFRYKPLEKDQGFEQVPAPSDWSSYCTKVSNEFITNNIIL
jgi:hypothetical protein